MIDRSTDIRSALKQKQRGWIMTPYLLDGGASFSSVSLLLHGDGTDASTTITDSSSNTMTPTVVGNTQIDTAQFKFGSASILCDGTNDCFYYGTHAAFNFGAGEMTWEFWVRFNSLASTQYVLGFGNSTSSYPHYISVNSSGVLSLVIGTTGILSTASSTIGTGTWYYIGVTRASTTWKLVYGTSGSTTTVGTSTTQGTNDFSNVNNTCLVGANSTGGFGSLNGWIDEMRITKGVARDISSVPTAAFPNA